MKAETFGEHLRNLRKEKEITLRKFATTVGLSPVYMSYIENNVRAAPTNDCLNKMIAELKLDKSETELFLDLAAKSKLSPSVSNDLPEYIMDNDIVRVALRTAKETDATDKEWQEFIDKLRNRTGGQE